MSTSHFLNRSFLGFFVGDRPKLGKLRFGFFVLGPLLILFVDLQWAILGPFSWLVQQLLLIYFLSLLSAIVAAVAYLRDIYGLDSDRFPFRHFISSFFGLSIPKIKISNQEQDADLKEKIEAIGGPAFLNIEPGYAVLTETLIAPANVYGQGNGHFISRNERIHEIVDLHEQEGSTAEVKATTRDGIPVTVENLKYNFRLWDNQWEMDLSKQLAVLNPFPCSAEAIHNLVYNRSVAVDDHGKKKAFAWRGAVGGKVHGIIKEYISEHWLNDVIASHEHLDENPRVDIRNRAYSADFKKDLRSMGTVLRWWDPGEFKSLEPVEGQFLSNWSVDIQRNIQLNQAYGEAQKQAYAELGRAEAEAELLISIIHSLDGIRLADDKDHTLQNLILMRTAQVIRALNTTTPHERPNRTKRTMDGKE